MADRRTVAADRRILRVEDGADRFGLHPRTLQRRLAAESLVFEGIVEQVRRNRAETYLAESAIPMSHVAAMLGYAEQASFNRACHRWFGSTPGERRRDLQRRGKASRAGY